jgi:hypothetical protein
MNFSNTISLIKHFKPGSRLEPNVTLCAKRYTLSLHHVRRHLESTDEAALEAAATVCKEARRWLRGSAGWAAIEMRHSTLSAQSTLDCFPLACGAQASPPEMISSSRHSSLKIATFSSKRSAKATLVACKTMFSFVILAVFFVTRQPGTRASTVTAGDERLCACAGVKMFRQHCCHGHHYNHHNHNHTPKPKTKTTIISTTAAPP